MRHDATPYTWLQVFVATFAYTPVGPSELALAEGDQVRNGARLLGTLRPQYVPQ
jgi:hypothetical protein